MALKFGGLGNYFSAITGQQASINDRAGNNLRADVNRLGEERASLLPFSQRNIGQIGNAESRLRRSLGGQASSALAQREGAPPVSFRGALDQATRRMRARTGIVNRGEAAIKNQTLRDRIQVARTNASRRGSIHNALQTSANIREGVNTGIANANQRIAESRANMFGSLAGAATSAFINSRSQSQGFAGMGEGVTEQSLNMGTAAADAMINPGPAVVYS